jgi:undecaprenyl-diphosphatase
MAQTALRKTEQRRLLRFNWSTVWVALDLVALIGLSFFVRVNKSWPEDVIVLKDVEGVRQPVFDVIMRIVGQPGYPPQVYAVVVLIFVILWLCKLKWEAISEAFAVIGIGAVGLGIKMFVDRTRPPQDLLNGGVILDNGKFSFPAGHVESYVAIFGFLMVLSWKLLPERNWVRWLTLFVYGLMLALIGISRIYLGEHWPLDVVGGYLFGAFWLWLTVRFYEWGRERGYFSKRQ